MNEDRLKYLLERYLANECSPAEQEELDEWFHTWNPGIGGMQRWLEEAGNAEALSNELYTDFSNRLLPPAKRNRRVGWYAVAAAAAVLAVFIILFYPTHRPNQSLAQRDAQQQPANTIRPGSNKAVLTLADGSQIALSDSGNVHIATQNNMEVRRRQPGSISYHSMQGPANDQQPVYNTLTTPRGCKYSLTLADGTVVTLDAASSISYPVVFTGKERRVAITGQAYIEVVHNAAQPFRVSAKGQLIEDLGTAFNVKAYTDEQAVKTTLIEGALKVVKDDQSLVLTPGQQAIVTHAIRLNNNVNLQEEIAWKNGEFRFERVNVKGIMQQLARWYNIEVSYKNEVDHIYLSGVFSRKEEMRNILEVLETTGKVAFQLVGNKVIVTAE
jgi:ferric-dicitrate binding protein FerR (iron transport regulator)